MGGVYELVAEQRDARLYPPPGRLINVGDWRLHLDCEGPSGGPTVVMLAGGGTPAVASYGLRDRIARFARVCSYDREGLGWSDDAELERPLSFPAQIADLERVLGRGHVAPPYVFVPESFGGLIALGFIERHPNDVAGAVFADSVDAPLWFGAMTAIMKREPVRIDPIPIARDLGIVRLALPFIAPAWTKALPAKERGELFALYAKQTGGYSEAVGAFEVTPASQRPGLAAGALGDKPIIVIRHGTNPPELEPEFRDNWLAAQIRLSRLSRNSRIVVATGSGHEIAQENPDLVARCVAAVISGSLNCDASGARGTH